MRFGGHETFAVREGWIHKGMKLLLDDPSQLDHEYASDSLGVGRNMAKSIRHWLLATQLAERPIDRQTRKRGALRPTRLIRTISQRDPYFLELGTWWALHINLANNFQHALTWWWFFNHFLRTRFERATCVEGLRRYLTRHDRRVPRLKTLQRDVACLLTSYARDIPPSPSDPEDATDSPFTELGLLAHFRESGAYGREPIPISRIPVELIPYSVLTADERLAQEERDVDVPVREACIMVGGPGRCFGLDLEAFCELSVEAEARLGRERIRIVTLAGERVLRFEATPRENWLASYYDRIQTRPAV